MAGVGLVFGPTVAVPGMLMLAVGDPVSGLLGSGGVGEWKSPGVVAATFGVCFALAAPVTVPEAGAAVGSLAAAAGAAGAAVADGYMLEVRGYVIDDNATIPVYACLAIQTVFWVA
jgi:dolichol kinase